MAHTIAMLCVDQVSRVSGRLVTWWSNLQLIGSSQISYRLYSEWYQLYRQSLPSNWFEYSIATEIRCLENLEMYQYYGDTSQTKTMS